MRLAVQLPRLASLVLVLAATFAGSDAGADAPKPLQKAPADPTALVPAGTYRPLFPPTPAETSIPVRAFRMDREPVTNAEFLSFVRRHREWARGSVAPILAESGYLAQWRGPDELGPGVDGEQPVVSVSWFAARAFCASRGERLPAEAEWERAAAASRTQADGSLDAAFRAELLATYSRPTPARLAHVGAGAPNLWGLRDMHGLVWEWVADFGNAVAAFSAGPDRLRFCGAGASAASDGTDFAAFERSAFRSSLRASYAIKNLGFRCAADVATGGST
jgi:sulfatase modifying factor 1